MDNYRQRVEESVAFFRHAIEGNPEIVVVLGSGLTGFDGLFESCLQISYENIPNFPEATSPGHQGRLHYGSIAGKRTVILEGRCHYYEGYSTKETTLPIRVLSLLGAHSLITLNAAGGLNPALSHIAMDGTSR